MRTDSDRNDRTEQAGNTGDLSTDTFRKHGHETIDWIAEYLEDPTRSPVLSQSRPGDTIASVPGMLGELLAPVAEREAANPGIREKGPLDAMMSLYCACTVAIRRTHPWTTGRSRLATATAPSARAGVRVVDRGGSRLGDHARGAYSIGAWTRATVHHSGRWRRPSENATITRGD